jgi:hypothetical protein
MEQMVTLEPSYELAMSRAYCIMLLPLVKKGFQKVRLSHLLGTSAGNANPLSVVVPFGTSPIGQGDPTCRRQSNTVHKINGKSPSRRLGQGTRPRSSVSHCDVKAAWNFDFSSLPRFPFR